MISTNKIEVEDKTEIKKGEIVLFYFEENNERNKFLVRCFISSVQSLSHVQLFVTPWTAACQAFLSITNSWSLLKLMSIESVMSSSHLILCHPLLLLPSIFPSISVFSNESILHIRWPKYCSFSFSISPSKEYSSPWCPRDSQVFSNTIQKHQFFGTQLSLWSSSHIHTWLLEKP